LGTLELIKDYFGAGGIYKTNSAYNYEVGSYKICFESIIPFFTKHPFPAACLKAAHYSTWAEIVGIMYSGKHLTDKKLEIEKLKSTLNKYKNKNEE